MLASARDPSPKALRSFSIERKTALSSWSLVQGRFGFHRGFNTDRLFGVHIGAPDLWKLIPRLAWDMPGEAHGSGSNLGPHTVLKAAWMRCDTVRAAAAHKIVGLHGKALGPLLDPHYEQPVQCFFQTRSGVETKKNSQGDYRPAHTLLIMRTFGTF